MAKTEKEHGFMDKVKNGLGFISQIISASILPPIAQGTEMVMNNIEDRVILIENRILRKISVILIIGFGGVFLIFALFFLIRENLGWSNPATFFSIGITVFVIGLLLKLAGSGKIINRRVNKY